MRSSTETVVAIVQAFLEQRTWTQAALARRAGVQPGTIRRRLQELEDSGFPLSREDDHPHVYWSVPRDWFPGGVVFGAEDIPELLRQLGRQPRGAARDRLIRRILEAAPRAAAEPRAGAVVPPSATESEEAYLPLAEDAAIRRTALHFRYYTASRGAMEWRHASVQRVVIGPPARMLAVCHRDGTLKWFRLDNVLAARLDPSAAYRGADPDRVEAVLRQSLDGFHQGTPPVACAFVVRAPESNWVERNLPAPFSREPVAGGVRFSVETAGVLRLARFVVGLGAAARVETAELAAIVKELAEGALGQGTAPSPSATDHQP